MEYEVLWYVGDDKELLDNYETKTFKKRDAAMRFYEKHKNDPDKFAWWVTKRDDDGYILEDIVY